MNDWGRAIPFLGIYISNFRYCVFAVHRLKQTELNRRIKLVVNLYKSCFQGNIVYVHRPTIWLSCTQCKNLFHWLSYTANEGPVINVLFGFMSSQKWNCEASLFQNIIIRSFSTFLYLWAILGMYKSLHKHECRNSERGRAISFWEYMNLIFGTVTIPSQHPIVPDQLTHRLHI